MRRYQAATIVERADQQIQTRQVASTQRRDRWSICALRYCFATVPVSEKYSNKLLVPKGDDVGAKPRTVSNLARFSAER
jgi:hypothetical protein